MRLTHAKRSAKPVTKPTSVTAPKLVAAPVAPLSLPPTIGHSQPPVPMKPIVLRVQGAAHALQCSERTVWSLIGQKRLRVSRVNGITLVHVSSIEELLFLTADKPPAVTPRVAHSAAAQAATASD